MSQRNFNKGIEKQNVNFNVKFRDYNKKLDTFILFIFEVICQKNNINIVNNGQLLPANDIDSNLNTNSTNNTSNSLMNGNCAKVITEELINYLKNNINCENTNIQESYIKSLVDGYLNQLSKPKYENVNTFKEIKEEMLPNNKQILMLQANNDMMKSPNMSFIDNNDVRSVRSDYSFSNLNNGLSNNIYSKNGFDAEKRNGQSNIFNSHEQNGSYYDIASLNDDIFSNKGAWQNNGHNIVHTPKSVKSSIDINDLFFKNNSTEFNLNGSFIENSNHAQPISTIINENTDNIEISQHSDTQTGKN